MSLPISPRRILALAQDIAGQAVAHKDADCEVRQRNAVGRAYYAVFLTGRDKFKITATSGVHTMVEQKVSSADALLGLNYSNLRVLREVADYQFPPNNPSYLDWENNWLSAQDLAEELLIEIRKLP